MSEYEHFVGALFKNLWIAEGYIMAVFERVFQYQQEILKIKAKKLLIN